MERLATPRKKHLSDYVSTDTMILAGFNYHEASQIHPEHPVRRVYIGHIEPPRRVGINNIIVERIVDHRSKDRRRWTEWYYQTIPGQIYMDCGPEEAAEFDRRIAGTVRRKNRVAGKNLEGLLKKVIEDSFAK